MTSLMVKLALKRALIWALFCIIAPIACIKFIIDLTFNALYDLNDLLESLV